MDPIVVLADVEKARPVASPTLEIRLSRHGKSVHTPGIASSLRAFERTLIKYNLETRGIQRVEDYEKVQIGWLAYLQVFVLWVSVNLAANNVTLGMLGPAIYELSFRDASFCAVFGALVGSIPVAWIATWGPLSGNRTMV